MSQRKNKFKHRDASGDLIVGDFVEEANAVYVDGANGNDGYSGDRLHPVRTIAAAIRRATALGATGRIVLQRGNYAEGNLTPPTGYTLEGVDRVAVIITGAGAANPVLLITGINTVKDLTIAGVAAQTELIEINSAGAVRIENVQLTAGAAAATIGILQTAGLVTTCIDVDVNMAGGAATGPALQVVAGTIQFQSCTLQSNTENLVDTGICILQGTTVTNNDAAAAAEGVFSLTTAATLTIIDSTLNNTNPNGAPNGYGVDNGDASAITIDFINARLQNNGGYVAATIPVIPEGVAEPSIMNLFRLFAAPADVDFGAGGVFGFETGIYPQVFPDINSPLWAGLGGGATPFAAAEYDKWSAIMRIARGLDALINTMATGTLAGGPVALAAYAGGLIP